MLAARVESHRDGAGTVPEMVRPRLVHKRPENESLLELTCVARLAMGVVCDSAAVVDWRAVLGVAARERCATLAWLRSAAQIRGLAPADVSLEWRRHALAAIEESTAVASELAVLLAMLNGAGITPIVLKGQPLAVQLYGDAAARPLTDVDLLIPTEQRGRAHELLVHNGWQHLKGCAPAEGVYRRSGQARNAHVEVHSSILDDGLLAHLRVPDPESQVAEVYGTAVRAPSGPLVPIFLAVHLAKHALVPLLWWIDFDAAWRRMSSTERAAARAMAARLRLDRYLAWAEVGIDQLRVSVDSPRAAATVAMRSLLDFHARHNAVRVAMLATSTRQRLTVMAAWVWPPALRHAPLAYLRTVSSRSIRWLGRMFRTMVHSGNNASSFVSGSSRTLQVPRQELIDVVRTAMSEDVPVWIRVRGTSMLPTIPRLAEVRVRALPPRDLRRGDVVLAQLPGGQPVLHRVHRLSGDAIILKGDNMRRPDEPVPLRRIVGIADQVRAAAQTYPILARPHRSLRVTIGRWRSLLQRWL